MQALQDEAETKADSVAQLEAEGSKVLLQLPACCVLLEAPSQVGSVACLTALALRGVLVMLMAPC